MTAEDHALLVAWGAGDEDAFRRLVERHAPLVRAKCRRQLGDADAEDATQAVFVLLSRKPDAARRAPTLAAWLLTTAGFVVANARRAQRRRQRAERAAVAGWREDQPVAATSAAAVEIDRCLDHLPAAEREALIMRFIDGHEDADAAHTLGVAEGTVRSRVSRGIARLRGMLERRGIAVPAATLMALVARQADGAEAFAPAWPPTAAANVLADGQRGGVLAWATGVGALILCGAVAVAFLWSADRDQAEAPRGAARPAPRRAAASLDSHQLGDAAFGLRLNDLERSWQRFDVSPYRRWADSTSGRRVLGGLGIDDPLVALRAAFGGSRTLSFCLAEPRIVRDGDAGGEADHGLRFDEFLLATDAERLPAFITPGTAPFDRIAVEREDGLLIVRPAAHRPTGQRREHRPAIAPEACVEFGVGLWNHDPSDDVAVSLHLDRSGFRSRQRLLTRAEHRLPLPSRGLDPSWVGRVPGDALAAMVRDLGPGEIGLDPLLALVAPVSSRVSVGVELQWTNDGPVAVVRRRDLAGEPSPDLDDVARVAEVIARARLPHRVPLAGRIIAFVQPGLPVPALTIRLAVEPTIGRDLLARIARGLQVTVVDDACRGGIAGVTPLSAAYRDGDLVVTTHAGGMEACDAGGFAAATSVAEALTEVPSAAYAALILRSAALAEALAPLIAVSAADAGIDLPPTLIPDISAAVGIGPDVIYTIAEDGSRSCVGLGPVCGLLALVLDPGRGDPPWRGIVE